AAWWSAVRSMVLRGACEGSHYGESTAQAAKPGLFLGWLFFWVARASCSAVGPSEEADSQDLIPEHIPLWKESDLWDHHAAVREGLGYNDNVLLSATSTRGSPFLLSG